MSTICNHPRMEMASRPNAQRQTLTNYTNSLRNQSGLGRYAGSVEKA
jgi:hypothetical protein